MNGHLTVHDGGSGPEPETGLQLLLDIYDLVSDRFPRLPMDDPTRPSFAVLLPLLARDLHRPRVALATPESVA